MGKRGRLEEGFGWEWSEEGKRTVIGVDQVGVVFVVVDVDGGHVLVVAAGRRHGWRPAGSLIVPEMYFPIVRNVARPRDS